MAKIVLGEFNAQVGKEAVDFPSWQSHSSQSHERQWIPDDTVCSNAEYAHTIDIPSA
jgi:hypothetical protein